MTNTQPVRSTNDVLKVRHKTTTAKSSDANQMLFNY